MSAMDGSGPLVAAHHLSHTFHDAPSGPTPALRNVSLSARQGEFVVIVGPSGCGKSTLLRILGGLLKPGEGRVEFQGHPLTAPQADIGFVFQRSSLMPWRAVLQNVVLPLEIQGMPRREAEAQAREWIRLVGLAGFERNYPRQLSGGMQQRVALARALVHDPEVLLLDEPFGSLDALTRERMNLELVRIWNLRRKTAIMVTHSIPEAVFLADRVLVMSSRPGHIHTTIEVTLSRPRDVGIMATEAFGYLTQQVRLAINEDEAVSTVSPSGAGVG